MHIPTGFNKTEMGDIDVIVHDGVFHLFHLCLMSHDRVDHLTSRDGLNWRHEKPALETGDPGAFDDDQIWTMGVFEHGGRFFMLYTGLSRAERGKVQRAGLATSTDLFTWTKYEGNPVACADPLWYEATPDATHRVDWRDPRVFVEDGVMHAVISARSNAGPRNRRGCAGYLTSTDGYHWQVRPPLHVLGNCYDFETPALCKLNGRYYLTGISGRNREAQLPDVFRVADKLEGPYRRTLWDALLPPGNFVFKPCRWNGRTLFFHSLRGTADWPAGGGAGLTSVAPPKVADTEADGTLVLRPLRQWDSVAKGPPLSHAGAAWRQDATVAQGSWQPAGATLQGVGGPGMGALLVPQREDHFILEAELDPGDACEFGVALRCDDEADLGTFISVVPGRSHIELYTQQDFRKTPCAGVTYRWRGRRVVQDFPLPRPVGPRVQMRVVAYGPYVEASLDDRVLISALTMFPAGRRLGLFAEDGRITLHSLSVQPLNPPDCLASCD